ncbi:hypothetical protein TRICI_000834 [Trichomonascus ciferrii]|uniref:Uncharacterized protein n=1 Tax=Trichomonascus ciferrii TaxID=44093 RepID=A0A642VAZ8_9ASCO|nr:hypothetical protein TRICI_000834 [Trichomonascus ciferrii]
MSEQQEFPTTSTFRRRKRGRDGTHRTRSLKQRRLRLLREDRENFDVIAPLATGLESDSDSDSFEDLWISQLQTNNAIVDHAVGITEVMRCMQSAWMELIEGLESGEIDFLELARKNLKTVEAFQAMESALPMQCLIEEDETVLDDSADVMEAIS